MEKEKELMQPKICEVEEIYNKDSVCVSRKLIFREEGIEVYVPTDNRPLPVPVHSIVAITTKTYCTQAEAYKKWGYKIN